MMDAVSGALVGALLTEVINAAKLAYRCKENCKNLLSTLNSVSPLLDRVAQSSDSGNAACQAWLSDFNTLLVEAKSITEECTRRKSRLSFAYMKRKQVSSSILGIESRIKDKIPQASLIILDYVQSSHQKSMAGASEGNSTTFRVQEVPKNIVAFEENPFEKLKRLIISAADEHGDPITIGLKGRGGAGKTLLAKMVNNDEEIREKYAADSILYITVGRDATIPSIFSTMGKLLNDGGVFERDYKCGSQEEQRNYLLTAFKMKKVLLILDDVWNEYCKDRAMIDWLKVANGPGSVTLITTRNNFVLTLAKAKHIVDVENLSKEESWRLFCYHAFESNLPPSVQIQRAARDICEEWDGLPLALEVIASAMWEKKDEWLWSSALSHLKRSESMCNFKSVDELLFHRLKFSYEELDDVSKKCFLYFAAYPEDYEIWADQLCSIWDAEELFGKSCDGEDGIPRGWTYLTDLADKSLIDLSNDGKIAKIHDLLRDLAMRIICEAKPGEWASECCFHLGKVLKTFPIINNTVKRLSLIGSRVAELPNGLQVPQLRVCLLRGISSIDDGRHLVFPKCYFSSMSELQFLGMSSIKDLGKTRFDNSGYISTVPNFGGLRSLLHLDLSCCRSLKELSESIKELKSLTHLNLSWFESLEELSKSIKELKSLTHLNLSKCESLKELPESIKELKSLTHLNLSKCRSLKELPKSIKELKSLIHLDLSWCRFLKELPESIKELKSLTYLNLSWCESLKELPKSIKELKSLTYLNLSRCGSLKEVPESIKELKSLTYLDLSKCIFLEGLPNSITELKSLIDLNVSNCIFLNDLPKSITEVNFVSSLDLSWCKYLEELPESIKELKSLIYLNLSWCESLKEL